MSKLHRENYNVYVGVNGMWFIEPKHSGAGWYNLTFQQMEEVLATKFY